MWRGELRRRERGRWNSSIKCNKNWDLPKDKKVGVGMGAAEQRMPVYLN